MILKDLYHYYLIKRSGLFDANYYLQQNPDVRQADIDPLWHFVRVGWREGRNPSKFFNTKSYLKSNLDVQKASINPIKHYICFGKDEGRDPLGKKPLIEQKNNYLNFHLEWRGKQLKKFLNHVSIIYPSVNNIHYIYLLPLFSTGGAELVTMNFIRLVTNEYKDSYVLLIITDFDKMDISTDLPANLIPLNLEKFLDTSDWDKKRLFIFDLINMLQPSVIHNINSSIFWQLLIDAGERIKEISKVYANIFCIQYHKNGSRTGYAELFLKKTIKYLDGLISDNQRFINDAIDLYNLHFYTDLFHILYTPSTELEKNIVSVTKERLTSKEQFSEHQKGLKCLWAGRLDNEKQVGLFFEIVKQCDFCQFDMYGQSVVGTKPDIPKLPNLSFFGSFDSFRDVLHDHEYDAFIFTSKWEGLPTTLIGIGNWGIPIIAPAVGGVGELVNGETGYLLKEKPDVNDYIKALREIQTNPKEAKKRALRMLELIQNRHNWNTFCINAHQISGYFINDEFTEKYD